VTIIPNKQRNLLGQATPMDGWTSWGNEVPDEVCFGYIISCLAGFSACLRLAPEGRADHLARATADLEHASETSSADG